MRAMAEGVEKEDIKARQLFQTLGWYRAVVREISAVAKPKAMDDAFAVRSPNRVESAADHTNGVVFKQVWCETRTAGLARFSIEHVAESALDHLPSRGGCVNWYLPLLHKIEGPNVI